MSNAMKIAPKSEVLMQLRKEDLVIRLDEERMVLQFLVPKRTESADDLRVFYEISAQEADQAKETIEQQLAIALLSFLSATYSSGLFNLQQYRDAAKGMRGERRVRSRSNSAKGGSAAKYEMAMEVIAQGLRTKSKTKMVEADGLLREAASAGSAEAAEYLVNLWPALKSRSDNNFK